MKTVELSVPHISLALKRGERLVLQDVLRVERAGDDLLAWVRQVDGSIQLQRLQAFFAPGIDVLLESQPVDGQSGKTEIFTASNDVPTTVFASKAVAQPEENSLSTLQDFEGDVLWLQLLVDDLAQLDQVWGLLAKQLHSAQSTLGNVYIKAVNDFEPIQLGDVTDVTMDRPSYFSQSVVPAHVPLKPVPSVTHLRLLVADDTGVAADGLTSKTTPTIWGKTDPWTVVRLVVDVDGDGSVSDAEAAAFLAEVAADVVGNFSWNDWPAPLAHGTSLNILALGWDRASRSWSNADPTTGLPVNVPPEARLHLTIDTQANLPTLNDLAVDNAISLSEQAAGVVFSGTGEPGAQVFLQRVQGSLSPLTNEVLVDAQGHWSVTVNQSDWGQMASGSMTVQVRQVDPAGNDSGWTSPISVSLDLILAAPSGLQISSDTGTDATDGVTLTTQQVISGFAVPGTTVKVFKDPDNDGLVGAGELLSTVTADAATGAFQSDPLTFVDGSYRLRAIASAGGVDSLASSVKTLTVDTLAPQPSMSDAAGAAQGPGFINISKRDAGTSFGGASENGLPVILEFRDANNQVLKRYSVTPSGSTWQKNLTSTELSELTSLAQGQITVVATQTDVAGNTGTATRSVTVDTIAPAGERSQQAAVLALQAAGELSGGVDWADVVNDGQVLVPIALPDNLGAGGSLVLTWGGQQITHSVTDAEVAQGYAQVSVTSTTLLAAGGGWRWMR